MPRSSYTASPLLRSIKHITMAGISSMCIAQLSNECRCNSCNTSPNENYEHRLDNSQARAYWCKLVSTKCTCRLQIDSSKILRVFIILQSNYLLAYNICHIAHCVRASLRISSFGTKYTCTVHGARKREDGGVTNTETRVQSVLFRLLLKLLVNFSFCLVHLNSFNFSNIILSKWSIVNAWRKLYETWSSMVCSFRW